MAKQYIIIRMPRETYENYKHIQEAMRDDLHKIGGDKIKLPMTKVFHMIASKDFNKNCVRIDLQQMLQFLKAERER